VDLEPEALRARIRRCLPSPAFVAAWGPDAAVLVEVEDGRPVEIGAGRPGERFDLADVPDTWAAGRAFGRQWEVLWRYDGGTASMVLAGSDVPESLLEGAQALPPPGDPEWRRVSSPLPGRERPAHLLLFHAEDQRLPRHPRYHVRSAAAGPLRIAIEEWGDDEGLRWVRYVGLAIEQGTDEGANGA
jgi:hypothetical protein